MRLIDADDFFARMENDTDLCAEMETDGLKALKKYLDMQSTAYDIGKIVEELEVLKRIYFLTIANTGDEKSDFAYENVGNALDKAIEIVKHGVVSDDVCEWKDKELYGYYTSCTEFRSCIACKDKYWKYCPYCGKKIKAVE